MPLSKGKSEAYIKDMVSKVGGWEKNWVLSCTGMKGKKVKTWQKVEWNSKWQEQHSGKHTKVSAGERFMNQLFISWTETRMARLMRLEQCRRASWFRSRERALYGIVANWIEVDSAVDREAVQLFKPRFSWSVGIGLKDNMSEGVLN